MDHEDGSLRGYGFCVRLYVSPTAHVLREHDRHDNFFVRIIFNGQFLNVSTVMLLDYTMYVSVCMDLYIFLIYLFVKWKAIWGQYFIQGSKDFALEMPVRIRFLQ